MIQSLVPDADRAHSNEVEMPGGYAAHTLAAPSQFALALGFFIAVIIMGIVSVQAAAFSSRHYKYRKLTVIVVNVLVLYSCGQPNTSSFFLHFFELIQCQGCILHAKW
ncbi:hypothetical protein DL93DRAFT_1223466 [Clavulina sp. PMI_390]|nr:hypothetical protein DL93DRAFT_1223466 [Clavulina sp. PMI_390]